ncbi:ATP-binding cassette domain-containing protein [Cohnella hongkongensis]|uniref:ATP-binding cassette domain-containing protein n=1 Tax=Cohnella hongkongensis TaxID=178337 RepID=A0ABV9FGD2_9BACL
MAFFTLFMSAGQAASNLTLLIPNLIDSGSSFKRIGEILDYVPEVREAAQPLELPPIAGELRMENVTFGYAEDSDQLKAVSLRIPAGSYAAFVGPSGSGKSTALQLLARFYDPKEGKVSIDGQDLREVAEASLRQRSAVVLQEPFLFNTTIRDNLLLARPDAGEAEMIEAAKLARIHETIAGWPDGYDTPVHQEGASLSGGQRQRISIARALLKNSELLLLDEITSALDPAAEAGINETLRHLREGRTIVSVTHRLDSVVHADLIFVFNDGRVVESGSHDELIRQAGLYREMWDKQHGFLLSQDGLHASVDEERLARLPFFKDVEPEQLRELAGLFATETYPEGAVVVREGETGDKFYLIVRGSFEIVKRSAGGEAQRVAVLQDGDHFGEIALLKGVARTATVRTLGPSVAVSMRRDAFLALTAGSPRILQVVEKTLRARL